MSKAEQIFYDVVIIGAGPAGLSAAISIKQQNFDIKVALIEKGSQIGAHIISGAILDPQSLTELLPNWQKDNNNPIKLAVGRDSYYFLSKNNKYKIANFLKPKILKNENAYIISLGNLCQYLAQKAEELGVEIFTAFAAQKLLFNKEGAVNGVELGDFGLDRNNNKTANFMPGPQLYTKYLLIAEGARGSLAKQAIEKFDLDKNTGPQKYALGLKEIWQIDARHHKLGLIEHFIGFPNKRKNLGGAFIYHTADNKISIGFIGYLNYKNPYTSPYQLFEQFKKHASISKILQNGTCLSYGARAINCGGYYSVPKLTFPGGMLLGCSAGFVNSARIKGIHNAISSGMLCASQVVEALSNNQYNCDLIEYQDKWKNSDIGKDLYKARNFANLWQKFGLLAAGADLWLQQLFKFSFFNNLNDKKADYKKLSPAKYFNNYINIKKQHASIANSLSYANLIHDDNQPCHLIVKNDMLQQNSELKIYGGPSMFYCPAAVYEWTCDNNKDKYVIKAQNCLHCKSCDIKDPNQNIIWRCPQGGSGPNYQDM